MDGVSDCGTFAVSVIAFIGSVFSPWYRWSGRKNPENNVCINVATYGPRGRFTMTDRGRTALRQTERTFTVGPSSLRWAGTALVIDVDEWGALPTLGSVKGQIIIRPQAMTDVELPLTQDGAHMWRPFAPTARIEVDLNRDLRWTGHGYFDANFGTRALEDDFSYWNWARYPVSNGSVAFYDADRLDGTKLEEAFHIARDGTVTPMDPPARLPLARSKWLVRRETRGDAGYKPVQIKPMLDAPFYTRSVVRTKINGEVVEGVHETVDLVRFRQPWLKPMIAVRVPRRRRWRFAD